MHIATAVPNSSFQQDENGNFSKIENATPIFLEQTISVFIWRYCPPVVIALGTFGNVATIVVYRRIKGGDSTQPLFLTSLAISDLFLL